MSDNKQTTRSRSARKTWIVALSNSESNTIYSQLVTGTANQIKRYIVGLLNEERNSYKENQERDWDYGTTSAREIRDIPNCEIFDVCGVWSTFHITVSARPADLTPTVHLGKKKGGK